MALISYPELAAAAEDVRAQYDQHRNEHAHFDELRHMLVRFPAALSAADGMYHRIMNEGHLGRMLREQIFLVTSHERGCSYAVAAHGRWLVANTDMSGTDVAALLRLEAVRGVSDRARALLAYTRKVAAAPYKIVAADLDDLYEVGWTQPEIVEALTVVSLSGWMNSYANSLGLQGSADRTQSAKTAEGS